MAEAASLAFYQQFYTESLFLVPEPALTDPENLTLPIAPITDQQPGNPEQKPEDETPAVKRFVVAGENRKGLALLFSLPAEAFAALPQNEFLNKILAAIQFAPADVAYVNIQPNYALNLFDLGKETKVQQVVAFGPRLLDLASGFQVNLYKPAGIGPTPLLIADPLQNIDNDVNRKKQLWSGLQAIFLK